MTAERMKLTRRTLIPLKASLCAKWLMIVLTIVWVGSSLAGLEMVEAQAKAVGRVIVIKSRVSVSIFSSSSIGTYSSLSKTLGGGTGFGTNVSATISSSESELVSSGAFEKEATVSGCLFLGSKRKVF